MRGSTIDQRAAVVAKKMEFACGVALPKKSRAAKPPPFDIETIAQQASEWAQPKPPEQPDATPPPGPGSTPHSALGNVFELVIMDEFRPNHDAPAAPAVRRRNSPRCSRATAAPASHR